MSKKNYFFFFFFFVCLFIFFNNLYFYYKKEVIFNNFFINIEGINYIDIYKKKINFNYGSLISTANNYLIYAILGKNIYIIFFFNFFTYFYIIYSFLKYFTNEKKKILFLLFTIINLPIISYLNFPSKDLYSFFSMIFLFAFYIEKKNLLLIFSIFFAFFSRNIQVLIIITILLLNLNIFSYFNKFFKKNKFLSYSALYLSFATIYHFLKKIIIFKKKRIEAETEARIETETEALTNILILPNLHDLKQFFLQFEFLFFDNLNFFVLETFFFYLIHIYLLKFFIKFFLKEEVNKVNFQICLISFIVIFISEYIKFGQYWYAHFSYYRYSNVVLGKEFNITLILDEYCQRGFFFLIYPVKILFLLFNEIFQLKEFKLSTLSQFLTFFILLITVISLIKKKFFIKFKFFLIFFVPLFIYSIPGHFSNRVVLYISTTLYVYFIIYNKYDLNNKKKL